jgi:hypothetical protein
MEAPQKSPVEVIAECLAEAHCQPVCAIDELQAEAILLRLAMNGYQLRLTRLESRPTVEHGN